MFRNRNKPKKQSLIYQENPVPDKPSLFRAKSWTTSVKSYCSEAHKLTTCLCINRDLAKAPYTWFVTINLHRVLSPKEINQWWQKAARNLKRKGVVALWVREPNKQNKVHYHILLRSTHSAKELKKIIENSLPPRTLGKWHKHLREVGPKDTRLLNYITKAKISGENRQKTPVDDLYANTRLLFKAKLGIRKYGTIGNFWVTSKKAIWRTVQANEEIIARGLEVPNLKELAKHAYELTQGYKSLNQIERSFAKDAHSPTIQNWIKQLFGETDGMASSENSPIKKFPEMELPSTTIV